MVGRVGQWEDAGEDVKHVVMTSGGIGSWAAGKRVASRHGVQDLTLLFTDPIVEHDDLYRFLLQAAANILRMPEPTRLVALARRLPGIDADSLAERKAALAHIASEANYHFGGGLAWIADGRTPWEVFASERFLGNSRVAPCTKILKQKLAREWLETNCVRAETICYVGIDWTEEHRFIGRKGKDGKKGKPGLRAIMAAQGWRYEAPMCEAPPRAKWQMHADCRAEGIEPGQSYKDGFSHDNCGGECVKAGVGHWAQVYRTRPLRYLHAEREEQAARATLGDVSILSETVRGEERRLTLSELRRRMECGDKIDLLDHGGCGCFIESEGSA